MKDCQLLKRLCLALTIALGYFAYPTRLSADVVCPSGSVLTGVDVSQHNGVVDWSAVSASGITFAFARVSDGTNLDTSFETNYAGIEGAGLIRGVYQSFEPAKDPVAQANLLLSEIGTPAPGDLPPVLDVEVTGGQSSAVIVSEIQTWIATVQQAIGRVPLIYTGRSFWNSSVNSSAFSTNALWIADWGAGCPNLPSAWTNWQFWQFTDTGSVPGISGSVDEDKFNGAMVDLLAVTTPNNLVVTDTADSGPGTLRQAILDANADTSIHSIFISFNIPGAGVQTIAPLSSLPIITRPVTIDGYTQPGASANTLAEGDDAVLLIQLTGTNDVSQTAIYLQAGSDGSVVRGLIINGYSLEPGILVGGSSSNVIAGNFLGTDATGRTNLANYDGVDISFCSFNRIGGTTPADRNIISGNSYSGIYFYGLSASNLVQGNFIGPDRNGTNAIANINGVVIRANVGNVIGGTSAVERNIISSNSSYAIQVESPENVIQGNFIGADVTGRKAVANYAGIAIVGDASGCLIGGASPGAGNLISSNIADAIVIETSSNIVQGNFIGVDVTGTNAMGNGGFGITADLSSSGNLIGGTTAGARNVIACNFHGIGIYSGTNNVIQGNFIGTDVTGTMNYGNSGYGIYCDSAPDTLIGGSTPGAGNLISGNGQDGININSPNSVIQGNFIGTDVTGTNAMFNGSGYSGIILGSFATFTQVGGTNPIARNIISGDGGIGIYSSSNNIQGNFLGIGPDGQTIVGAPGFGMTIDAASEGNLVGGDTVGAGNLISGWFAAIRIAGSNNVVQGNLIGTDATGTMARGNYYIALTLWGQNNLIGGLTSGACNIISASDIGIDVSGNTATGNTIQGNFIGTEITGMTALTNYLGIDIESAAGNLIGGTTPEAANVISGCSGYGLGIGYDGASNNIVQGNYFGLAADGITPLPNSTGLRIFNGASDNLIGGFTPAAGNVIADNATYGISAIGDGVTNNAILGNSIFSNGWYGIDLAEDGVTRNDTGDADDGQNHLQNFPEFASVKLVSGNVAVNYRVDSASENSVYPLTVEFFLADSMGQGKTLIYRSAYDTPQAFTNLTFAPAAAVNEGDPIISTATDANGNTSEFSAVAIASVNHSPVVANPVPDQGGLYGSTFNYSIAPDAFSDPDAGDALSYSANGLPPGVTFDGLAQIFSGTPTNAGIYSVTVTATDNGTPPLSTNDVFDIVVGKAPLIVTANNKSKLSGNPNPALDGALVGVTNNDNITIIFTTTADTDSPPGDYPITPVFNDPDSRLQFYAITTNAGVLTVNAHSLIVTNLADSGPGTLRQVIADAAAGETITFDVTGEIVLDTPLQPLDVDKALNIVGPGATNLAIRVGNVISRIFNIAAGPTTISGLTLSGGDTYNFYITDPEGGAIRNSAELTLIACAITNNASLGQGGAVWSSGPSASLTTIDCTFFANDAGFDYAFDEAGGAIWSDGSLRMTNCTFSANGAGFHGGAIYSSGNAVIVSSTVTLNGSGEYGSTGGGIYNDGGQLALRNSIVAGNYGNGYLQEVGGPVTSGDYNLFWGTNDLSVSGIHDLVGVDPVLGPLRDNGGPTQTHGLASISPALDAADAATSPATDQRGVTRPQGSGFDIGAFEGSLPVNHPPVVVNPVSDTNAIYGDYISITVADNIFADSDTGQTLAYSATSDGPLYFDPVTRTFSGSLAAGFYSLSVIATDDGAPSLSATNTFTLVVAKRPITASADNQSRPYGEPNSPLTITYYNLAGNPSYISESPVASTTATNSSPPGSYPIVLSGGSDANYEFVGLTNGTLTVADFSVDYQIIHSFGFTNLMGSAPYGLILGNDGILYGGLNANYIGFANGMFRINPDGSGYDSFSTNTIGIEGRDGIFYGVSSTGGSNNLGMVFKVRKDGTGFEILHHFAGGANDGSSPSVLIQGTNGLLFGATTYGGLNAYGTVFQISTNGDDYAVLHNFDELTEGEGPNSLLESSNGELFGTTSFGGPGGFGNGNGGTVFSLAEDGSNFSMLHSFDLQNPYTGIYPGGLIEGSDGALYGATSQDGPDFVGTVFKLNKDGNGYMVMHTFTLVSDGHYPGRLISDNGVIFGTTFYGSSTSSSGIYDGDGTFFKVNEDGSSYAVLTSFGGTNGLGPDSLLKAPDGYFYGTCEFGGKLGDGTVFRINIDGTNLTNLWTFNPTGGDGENATTASVEGPDGMLYGITEWGGSSVGGTGAGIIYRMSKDGSDYQIIHDFSGTNGDAVDSYAMRLFAGSNGWLYGADNAFIFKVRTNGDNYSVIHDFGYGIGWPGVIEGADRNLYGFIGGIGNFGEGILFRMATDGTGFTTLYNFGASPDDGYGGPLSLIQGNDGLLYGTTRGGIFYSGTIFGISTNGTGYTTLHQFGGGDGAYYPSGGLIRDASGVLFGATSGGGSAGYGTVFRMESNGDNFNILHSFLGTHADGGYPMGPLAESSDGTLFGTTAGSIGDQYSTLFRIEKDGSGYCVLQIFGNYMDGPLNTGGVIVDSDGSVYGTTQFGGASGFGAVFKLSLVNIPPNHPPLVAASIPDQLATYGNNFNFAFDTNVFTDPDAGSTLSYGAGGMPAGLLFDGATRTFNGTPTSAGTNLVTITATDDGIPPLSTNAMFTLTVAQAPLTVTAISTNRDYGVANPEFAGTVSGVVLGDNISATFDSSATMSSHPGNYPIIPDLLDPDGKLANYTVTTNLGTLTINGVTIEFSLSSGSPEFCWPTNAADFNLEYTDDLTPPVNWQPVTNGISTNGANICIMAAPAPDIPTRFYRLHLP